MDLGIEQCYIRLCKYDYFRCMHIVENAIPLVVAVCNDLLRAHAVGSEV